MAQVHEEQLRVKEEEQSLSSSSGIDSCTATTTQFHYDTRGLANAANNLFLTAPIYHHGYEWLESFLPIMMAMVAGRRS